jgi:serine/threonine-protein kinase
MLLDSRIGPSPCFEEEPMSAPAPLADRNLIFGLLALQMDFVSREQLLDAMHAWMLDKHMPLGDVLCRRGVLNDEDRNDLDRLVQKHIKRHGGDPQASLAALRVEQAVQQSLHCLDDADVQASLAFLPRTLEPVPLPPSTNGPASGGGAAAAGVPAALRYRRLRKHARGGLGEVFVALDEELNREVALKEIQDQFADQADARARFLREAEVTGKLEHPGVVPVYGLGAYADGRPFYAMRFIRGESLHDAVERFHKADDGRHGSGERSLALRELLGRFVAVCNAVAYAHSRGVIHRDIKPANVMLGAFGETLVVDWGLAKQVGAASSSLSSSEPAGNRPGCRHAGPDATEHGAIVGTPAYLAPEQALGPQDQVGAHSDVYSLGATLYHLLTGRVPFTATTLEGLLEKVVCGDCPQPRQVNPAVPAALEAVCRKAMAVTPAQRFESARALSEEVERWLADEPVTAYREPLPVRLRRWGRRHRTAVTSAILLLAAGVVGLALGLWAVQHQKARTEQERDLAEANLNLARDAVDRCFNVATEHSLFRQPRMEKAKKLLLEKTLPFYRNFRARSPDDHGLQREEARQWFRVGYIENVLGRTTEALEAYEQARDLQGRLVRSHPDVPEYQSDLARTLNNLVVLLRRLGKNTKGLEESIQARDILGELVAAYPKVARYQQDLGFVHNNRGTLLAFLGKPDEALKEYQRARRLHAELVKSNPEVPDHQKDLAAAHNNLGTHLSDQGRRAEARKEFDQARALQSQLLKAHPKEPEYKQDLATTCNNLGNLLGKMGESEAALRAFQQARDLQGQLVKTHPDVPGYQNDLAKTHHNLGVLLAGLRKPTDARKEYEQSRDLQAKLVEDHRDVLEYQNDLARTHNQLGLLLADLGKPEAEKEYRKALALRSRLVKAHRDLPAYQQELAETHANLGRLLVSTRPRDALKEYEQAGDLFAGLNKAHPKEPRHVQELARTCLIRAVLLAQAKELHASLGEFDRAFSQIDRLQQVDPRNSSAAQLLEVGLSVRANVLARLGQHQQADSDWDRILKAAPSGQRIAVRFRRAEGRARAGDYRRAAAEAVELARGDLPTAMLYNLAGVLSLSASGALRDAARPLPEREKTAEPWARQALALLRRVEQAGFFKNRANVTTLDIDEDLAVLRNRDDYKQFRATLTREKP